jgi:hypothetical protein
MRKLNYLLKQGRVYSVLWEVFPNEPLEMVFVDLVDISKSDLI